MKSLAGQAGDRVRPLDPPGKGNDRIYLGFCASLGPREVSEAEARGRRRKHPRTEINQPAYVSAGGSVMSCMVRNFSVEGAAIDVDNPSFVPAHFRLVIAKNSTVHECRIAWIPAQPDRGHVHRNAAGAAPSPRRAMRIGASKAI